MEALNVAQKFTLKPFETIRTTNQKNLGMPNKLNLSVVERYSKAYAASVCDDFFSQSNSISGKQMLSITNIQQVNMLTVRALYEKWQSETQRLRSPYFDYENPLVQDALKTFMNTVSQYISVKREHFEPLLSNATAESLVLILEPQTFYRELMRDLPNFRLTKENIAPLTKYIHVNKIMLPRLVERLNGQDFVFANQAITWVDEITQQVDFEKPEKYLNLFSERVELPLELLPQKFEEKVEEKNTNGSFFDQELISEPIEEKPAYQIPVASNPVVEVPPTPVFEPKVEPVMEVIKETAPIIEKNEEFIIEKPAVEPIIDLPKYDTVFDRKVEKVVEKIQNKESDEVRLNEKLATEQKSLNDQASSNRSVLDMHQSSKIEGLSSAISLNQRFLFTNNLFGGNIQAFSHALDELELCKDFGEAKELILKKYVPRYLWDITSAEAEEFIDIVKRRFN